MSSPLVLTPTNAQYDASGNLVQTRLTPQNAGFGAATGAQAMRSVQAQIRFQFSRSGVRGPGSGLPDPGLPDPGLPDPGLPDPGLPDPGLPDPGLPDPA